jgi:hypothetical protein
MTLYTFEYCSLHYLNQWLTHDKDYCKVLSTGSNEEKLSVLKKAGSFYKIARNLPTKYDVKKSIPRYQPVLEILDAVDKTQFQCDLINKILEIEREISKNHGRRNVLSLTTKFLWLKVQKPIIIYDSKARISIGTKHGDLEQYYVEWTKSFKKHKENIKEVCAQLSELNLYAIDQAAGTKKYIKDISSKVWFHERVYDIYLWHNSNNA